MTGTIESVRKPIHSRPSKSVLALLDATDARYDNETMGAIFEFAKTDQVLEPKNASLRKCFCFRI
jgi:hypothetical protein